MKLKFILFRDITVYSWENIWEEGNGDKAYKLANAGYKVMEKIAYKLGKADYKVMVTYYRS